MAQVLKIRDTHMPLTIFHVINSKTRIEILKALSWDKLSYDELQIIASNCSKFNHKHSKNIVAHHLRILKKFNLIRKQTGRIYFITMRGTRILVGIKLIEESEMFI